MRAVLKTMKWFLLISGMLVAILGISVLFMPLKNLVMLSILIGLVMLVSGVSEILSFCTESRESRSGLMLASGILSALFGVWTVFGSGVDALIAILPFIFAVWVMTSGIMRVVSAVALKPEGFAVYGWMLAVGLIGAVFGFLLLFSPVLSSALISASLAIMLIAHGVGNIIIFYRVNKIGNCIRRRFDQEGAE